MVELKDSHSKYNIIIVGVGGTGSHLASFLCQMIGNRVDKSSYAIKLADGDIVEAKNLRTQKFLPSDIGKMKSEVLAERYSSVFDIEVKYFDRFIESTNDLIGLMSHSYNHFNIIISCVDNNKARKIMDETFNGMKSYYDIIYIDTGNSSGNEQLTGQTVVGYRKGKDIILPSVSSYFPQMLEEGNEEASPSCGIELITNIQNIGANITSACTVFNILNNIINFKQIPGDLFTFNATTVDATSLKLNSVKDRKIA